MSRVSGITERVRLMVLRGELPAGSRVVDLHLAERFDVGRGTLREVLNRLAGDGLLVANESGGMRVVSPGADDLEELLQVRAALEGLSAALAAGRVRDGAVRADGLEGLASAQTVHEDRRFHRAIDVLAGNRANLRTLDRLWDRLVVATLHAPSPPAGHRELVAAITAGDPADAADAARRHVLLREPSALRRP
jgi:DNA-binding GntR family transcriptional regulator